MSISVYANNINYSDEFIRDKPPWKHWDDLDALKSNVNRAYCVKSGSVATRSGTYNTPAPITLKEFNINLSKGTKIKKVIVHYSQQKYSLSRSQGSSTFPVFSGATFTLLGTGQSKTGEAVPTSYTGYTLEFTGVTYEQLTSANFGLKIVYPRNNSTNTGRMCLGNVYLEIITEEPQIVLDIKTKNNNVTVNDNLSIECSVEHINSVEYNPEIDITIPSGLTVTNSNGHGTLTQSTDEETVYRWSSQFDNRTKNIITIDLTATTVGTHTIEIADTLTSLNKQLKINVQDYAYEVETTLNKQNTPVIESKRYKYTVTIKTNRETVSNPQITVDLPPNTDIIVPTGETGYTVESANNRRIIRINNPQLKKDNPYTLNLEAVFHDIGYGNQIIRIDGEAILNTNFLVQASSYESLGFTRLLIPEDYTEVMGDKINYTLTTVAKHTLKNDTINLHDWTNNLRVGVYNASEDDINDEDDFLSHVVWCKAMTKVKWAEYTCSFDYNSQNPLYIVYSHDYLGNPLYENISIDFSQPKLIETKYLNVYTENKPYPVPLKALLNNNRWGVVKLNKQTDTAPAVVYDWSGINAFKTEDISIRGLILNIEYNTSEKVEVQVTISADGYDTIKGYRNQTIQKGSGTLTMGGRFDLFGLRPHDLRGKANELTVEVVINNPYDKTATVEIRDVNLTVNYHLIEESLYGFEINGERSEEYGLYFYDMTPTLGTNNEIDEYHITGSDKSIVNRMNIKPKEIDIELAIDECDLKDELEIAEDVIVKLFTNTRNVLTNKPVEKYIIFDYLPNNRYWFVRKTEIKDKIDKGTYYMTVSLYIPRGTAEVIPKVVTGSSGATNGLISIEPEIHLHTTDKGVVELLEENTGQSLLVKDSTIKAGDTITIYNEDRRVTRKTAGGTIEEDITSGVDFSTTWFKLRGEYNFTSSTSIITDVQFYDRR